MGGFFLGSYNLFLLQVGVKMDAQGHIVVDQYQTTTNPSILCVGDATGKYLLTPGKLSTTATSRNHFSWIVRIKSAYNSIQSNFLQVKSIRGDSLDTLRILHTIRFPIFFLSHVVEEEKLVCVSCLAVLSNV